MTVPSERLLHLNCPIRYFPRSLKSIILRKPKRVINGDVFHTDWVCKVHGCALTFVSSNDPDVGNCNQCHVNWMRNCTHEDWLRMNQLGDYTPNPFGVVTR